MFKVPSSNFPFPSEDIITPACQTTKIQPLRRFSYFPIFPKAPHQLSKPRKVIQFGKVGQTKITPQFFDAFFGELGGRHWIPLDSHDSELFLFH